MIPHTSNLILILSSLCHHRLPCVTAQAAARCSSASLLTDPTPPGHAFIVRRRLQPSTPLGRVAVVACTRLRLLHLSASRHDLDVSPPSRLRLEVEPPLRLFALAPRGAALACATNRACLLCALPLPHVRAPATRLPSTTGEDDSLKMFSFNISVL